MTGSRNFPSLLAAPCPDENKGHKKRNPHKHREGVVINIAALHFNDAARAGGDRRRNAVRPDAVNGLAVAVLPEKAADGERRFDEKEVVSYDDVLVKRGVKVVIIIIMPGPDGGGSAENVAFKICIFLLLRSEEVK